MRALVALRPPWGACRRIVVLAVAASVGAVTAAGGGCDKRDKQEISPRSTVKLSLPPKPKLVKPQYRKAYDDGALTVEGLLREYKSFMGQNVKVRGKVVSVSQCPVPPPVSEEVKTKALEEWDKLVKLAKRLKKNPPPQPTFPPPEAPRTCKPRPHAYLVDEGGDAKWQLLVAGTMWSAVASLEEGSTVTLTGRFDRVTPDGDYVRQQGLIYLPDLPRPEPADAAAAPADEVPKAHKDKHKASKAR